MKVGHSVKESCAQIAKPESEVWIVMKNAKETKREKAKSLRYRKAIVKDLNFEAIQQELYRKGGGGI